MCRPFFCPSGHHCPEGLTCMLVFAIFSAVLGMFQFGFNTGVINAPQAVIEEFIADVYKARTSRYITSELADLIWAITVSIFAVGGMIGGLSGGSIANWCGRKCGLLLNNAIAILGATLMSSSKLFESIECLIMGRFFIGLNCGLNTHLVPMYLSEIAPMNLRGALGTVSQLGVTIGLLLSMVLGLPQILGSADGWPFLLGVAFIPAVLQLLLLPLCPESPRYLLITKGRVSEARRALVRLRCSNDVDEDIEEMRMEESRSSSAASGHPRPACGTHDHPGHEPHTVWGVLATRDLRMPLLIAIMMQLSQQLSGINAILNYSTNIFESVLEDIDHAKWATIGVGCVMVIMTLLSIPLMDKMGRRTLHLWGLGGMFITSIFFTISLLVRFLYHGMSYVSLISSLLFVVFFAVGPGSIPWLITAELFSQGPRPAAMSIAVMINWSANFLVGLTFPIMKRNLENYVFLPYTCFLAIFWTFTYHRVPETKNRTFEEISASFRREDFTSADSIQVSRKSVQSDIVYTEDKPMDNCGGLHHSMAPHMHHHICTHYGNGVGPVPISIPNGTMMHPDHFMDMQQQQQQRQQQQQQPPPQSMPGPLMQVNPFTPFNGSLNLNSPPGLPMPAMMVGSNGPLMVLPHGFPGHGMSASGGGSSSMMSPSESPTESSIVTSLPPAMTSVTATYATIRKKSSLCLEDGSIITTGPSLLNNHPLHHSQVQHSMHPIAGPPSCQQPLPPPPSSLQMQNPASNLNLSSSNPMIHLNNGHSSSSTSCSVGGGGNGSGGNNGPNGVIPIIITSAAQTPLPPSTTTLLMTTGANPVIVSQSTIMSSQGQLNGTIVTTGSMAQAISGVTTTGDPVDSL